MIDKKLIIKNIDETLFEPVQVELGWTGTNPTTGLPETADEFIQRDFIEYYLNVRQKPAAVKVLTAQALDDFKATQAAVTSQIESTVTVEVETT